MLARDLNDLCQRTLHVQLQGTLIGSRRHFDHARDMLEPVYGSRASKADLHVVLADVLERGNMVDPDQPPFANDRHPVAGVLDLGQDVRGQEDGPAISTRLGHHVVEFLLVERVQSAGGFVQDEQARFMHEGLHQPQLLFVAVRIFAEAFTGIPAQALHQAAQVDLVHAPAQVAQVLDDLGTAQAGIEGEFAGQVAHQLLDLCGLLPAVQPTDGGAAAVRVQQAHQGAHGGGFARPVGSQEAKDLAFLNVKGHVENAPAPAVAFAELVGLNDS